MTLTPFRDFPAEGCALGCAGFLFVVLSAVCALRWCGWWL